MNALFTLLALSSLLIQEAGRDIDNPEFTAWKTQKPGALWRQSSALVPGRCWRVLLPLCLAGRAIWWRSS